MKPRDQAEEQKQSQIFNAPGNLISGEDTQAGAFIVLQSQNCGSKRHPQQDTVIGFECSDLFKFKEAKTRQAVLARLGLSLREYVNSEYRGLYAENGTTCSMLFVQVKENKADVYSFNIGDGLPFYIKRTQGRWIAKQLSNEHKVGATISWDGNLASDPEYQRVSADRLLSGRGPFTEDDQASLKARRLPLTKRSNGLGLSRGLGDLAYETYGLSADPEIQHYSLDLSPGDSFLVASDGLFGTATTTPLETLQKLLDQCAAIEDRKELGQTLCALTRKQNKSTDDLSLAFWDPTSDGCFAVGVNDAHGESGQQISYDIALAISGNFNKAIEWVENASQNDLDGIILFNLIQNQDISALMQDNRLHSKNVNELFYYTPDANGSDKLLQYPLLHLAVAHRSVPFIQHLIQAGANLLNCGNLEMDACGFAREIGAEKLVPYLGASQSNLMSTGRMMAKEFKRIAFADRTNEVQGQKVVAIKVDTVPVPVARELSEPVKVRTPSKPTTPKKGNLNLRPLKLDFSTHSAFQRVGTQERQEGAPPSPPFRK